MRMKNKNFYLWFIGSLTINAFGNSMMILADIGSPPWTGAGQNIAAITPISIGISMIFMQLFALLDYLFIGNEVYHINDCQKLYNHVYF